MAEKTTKLAPAVIAAVADVKAIRDGKGLSWQYTQSEASAAIAFAAKAHDWSKSDAVKTFIALGEYGFLGNASQMRQALENLPEGDDLKLAKSAKAGSDLYS